MEANKFQWPRRLHLVANSWISIEMIFFVLISRVTARKLSLDRSVSPHQFTFGMQILVKKLPHSNCNKTPEAFRQWVLVLAVAMSLVSTKTINTVWLFTTSNATLSLLLLTALRVRLWILNGPNDQTTLGLQQSALKNWISGTLLMLLRNLQSKEHSKKQRRQTYCVLHLMRKVGVIQEVKMVLSTFGIMNALSLKQLKHIQWLSHLLRQREANWFQDQRIRKLRLFQLEQVATSN